MALAFYNGDAYLYNDTDSPLPKTRGAVVVQFQRGKWMTGFQQLEGAGKLNCIPFCRAGSADFVMVAQAVSEEAARLQDPLQGQQCRP